MNLLFLIILLPILSFLLLSFSAGRFSEKISTLIGVGTIGLTALIALYISANFLNQPINGVEKTFQVFNQILWNWISVGDFCIPVMLKLDKLSLTMILVVTVVGFLIHWYASWYMHGKEGYSRFFSYTNLFIASMLILVLADNLLLLYLGWEGVGLCSYLLIGFYYRCEVNGTAAIKAFIVTRIGDVFLAVGLFILYKELGTLNINELTQLVSQKWEIGSNIATLTMLMLLVGAVGKSAQLPLQTWLADAMAGPTPVSALIHATTMVTAGVYLIARTHGLFLMAPEVLHLSGMIGAITLLLASFSALVQSDIKRVLAYSTMSQIGYMFLALGIQAWDAAINHLVIHACFKALLFLSAGSVIQSCNHQQNMFKIGGLRKKMPMLYLCFLIGGTSLSAFPFTPGFYSKDNILWLAWEHGYITIMIIGLFGSFLTVLYTFRMIFLVFYGDLNIPTKLVSSISHSLPLVILMFFSTFIGMWPEVYFSHFFQTDTKKILLEIFSGMLVVIGILLSAYLYLGKKKLLHRLAFSRVGKFFISWFLQGGKFDLLYDRLFVNSYLWVAKVLQSDPCNSLMNFPVLVAIFANRHLSFCENRNVRWYAASIGFGAIAVLLILLFF